MFVRIEAADAVLRLYRQLGGVFPSEANDFEWHLSESERFLGVLVLVQDGCRYVLLGQQLDGSYSQTASGHEPSRDHAYQAMVDRVQQLKLEPPQVN
jgi:hypothetical protein